MKFIDWVQKKQKEQEGKQEQHNNPLEEVSEEDMKEVLQKCGHIMVHACELKGADGMEMHIQPHGTKYVVRIDKAGSPRL